MVARFHEGCLHRRVDGQIEEFIFTEASKEAVTAWAYHVERLMVSHENPDVTRWLVDLRLSGPLPENEIRDFVEYLLDCSGTIGKTLRIATITDTPEMFEELHSGIHRIFSIETRARWFDSSRIYEQRQPALEWLMQGDS